jgi:hypothetical protein
VFVRLSIYVLVVLFAAMPVSARPTLSSGELFYASSPTVVAGTEQYSPAYYLSSFNSEISRFSVLYPIKVNISTEPETVSAIMLPATPASGFMTLMGFICVSMISNRKIWLAGFTGLSLVGQNQTNPSLSSSESQLDKSPYFVYPKGHTFAQSDIPCVNSACNKIHIAVANVSSCSYTVVSNAVSRPDLNESPMVSGTRQFVCFSPALIFCRIPRGPPASPEKIFFSKPLEV